MLILVVLFACVYHVLGAPVEDNVSIPPSEKNSDIEDTVSQMMTSWKSKNATTNLIEAIIDDVESTLSKNPSLPRLTRGEILDLLENITKADFENLKKDKNNRINGQRAVMLVLPYSPKNDTNNNLEELYTKPPIIKIIDDQTDKPQSSGASNLEELYTNPPILKLIDDQADRPEMKPVRRRRPTLPPTIPQLDISSTTAFPTYHSTYSEKAATQQEITASTAIEPEILNQRPTAFSTSELNKPTKGSPLRKYPIKTVNKHTTSKYFVDQSNVYPSEGLKVIQPPQLNQMSYFAEERLPQVQDEILIAQESLPPKASEGLSLNDFHIPNHLKSVVKDVNFNVQQTEATQKPYRFSTELTDFLVPSTTSAPDMANVAENLTPEMQKLLVSFGLIPDLNEKPVQKKQEFVYNGPEKPTFHSDSFVQFKPLPDNAPAREDMEAFLAGFGLGRSSRRSKMKQSKDNVNRNKFSEIELDIFPDDMKDVLSDLGLADRHAKKISLEGLEKSIEKSTASIKNKYDRELEDLKKLKELVDVIKQLDTLNDTEVHNKVDLNRVKELVTSLNQNNFVPLDAQKNAPNPLNYDYNIIKTAVKRQDDDSTTTETVSTSAEETNSEPTEATSNNTTSTPSTIEAVTPNLKDLEDSFGGSSETTTTTTTTTEPPPPNRKSGFYHLVDWNTFLEVDDQRGRRVNLRFQPKAGDPKRFYSVTVP